MLSTQSNTVATRLEGPRLTRVSWVRSGVVLLVAGAVAFVVLLASSGGVSGGSQVSPVAAKPSSTISGCADGPRKRHSGTVLFGSVYFTSTADGEEVQSGHSSNGAFFAKQPVLVDGNASVVLRLPAKAPKSLVMAGFGTNNANDTMRVARLRQDSDPCGDQWAAYAGGFRFKGKHCLRLRVVADGRKSTVPFGLRKSCR
jgi:hypothetical protein